jgi:hypothetical protein
MKKLFLFLLGFIFLISGCTFNVDVLTPAPLPTPMPAEVAASPAG